mgnify:CR=1 FL=1
MITVIFQRLRLPPRRNLRTLPRLAAWLKTVRADWIHAHYLTSHGTLAWLAQRLQHRLARHRQLLGDLLLRQARAGRQRAVGDGAEQGLVDLIDQVGRDMQLEQRGVHRCLYSVYRIRRC